MNEQRIRRIFEVSVLLKGGHALIECIGGLALALVSTNGIAGLVNRLTQEELIEDPNDFISTHMLAMAQGFSVNSKNFYAFYLLSHVIVKLVLVAGLLRNKLWAYPASLVVLAIFVAYQIYRFSYTQSVIAHPTPARAFPDCLADSTNRTVSRIEAPFALAVLTTERKAA